MSISVLYTISFYNALCQQIKYILSIKHSCFISTFIKKKVDLRYHFLYNQAIIRGIIMQKERYIQFLTDYITTHRQQLDDLTPNNNSDDGEPLNYSDYLYDKMSNEHDILDKMSKELADLFYQKFLNDNITINLEGHLNNLDGKSLKDILNDESYLSDSIRSNIEDSILMDLLTKYVAIKTSSDEDDFVMLFMVKNRLDIVRGHKCEFCDLSLNLSIDYNKMELHNTYSKNIPCMSNQYKDKNNLNVKLEVNSKKLVFFNSPAKIIPIERENKYNISVNSTLGKIQETELYSLHNIGFFYIGDCCPSIYQKNKKIVLSNVYDESDNYDEFIKEYDYKGSICTDLHWFVVMDYNEFIDYCKNNNVKPKTIEHTVVDIETNHCVVSSKIVNRDDHDMNAIIAEITYGV